MNFLLIHTSRQSYARYHYHSPSNIFFHLIAFTLAVYNVRKSISWFYCINKSIDWNRINLQRIKINIFCDFYWLFGLLNDFNKTLPPRPLFLRSKSVDVYFFSENWRREKYEYKLRKMHPHDKLSIKKTTFNYNTRINFYEFVFRDDSEKQKQVKNTTIILSFALISWFLLAFLMLRITMSSEKEDKQSVTAGSFSDELKCENCIRVENARLHR